MTNPCEFCEQPFTPDKLRWYFGGECDARMGVSSTHMAFENMITSGIPTGGRKNVAEERWTDSRRAATAEHRCIRSHRLGHLSREHYLTLQTAYSGEDWTRTLDETHGRGPRSQLHSLFSHEVLQVLPLTRAARRGMEKSAKPTEVSSEPVYNQGETIFRGILSGLLLTTPFATVMPEDVTACRSRLTDLARWKKNGKKPAWCPRPEDVLAQLRVVVAQTKPDHVTTIRLSREALSKAGSGWGNVTYVVKVEAAGKPPPATTKEYILGLLRLNTKPARDQLSRIAIEAGKMLTAAKRDAKLETVAHVQRSPRKQATMPERSIQNMADAL